MSRPPATTFEHLQFHAANTPDRVALIMDDGEYTYGRFADDALRFTKALADLGIKRRQIVTIHHSHFYIEWLLTIACENLGAVSVSDNAKFWKRADYLYQHVDVGLTNKPADEQPLFRYHCLTNDWVHSTLRMDLATARKQMVVVPELDDLVRITRSSGSTGIPKLIPRTRQSQEHFINVRYIIGEFSPNSRVLVIGATFSLNANLIACQVCARIGGAVVRKNDMVKAISNDKITNIYALPLALENLLLIIPEYFTNNDNLFIEVIGSSLSNNLKHKVAHRLGARVVGNFGANECNNIMSMIDPEIGIVRPGTEVEIRDEKHQKLPDGEPGLIAARNAGMVAGYYKNEEETLKRFHNGWFYTGDAGIKIGPRKVKLLGRADDMVIMGGVKQSPLPIEERLRTNRKIKDAAVVGIKASDGGDLVCVALVPDGGADMTGISAGISKQLWETYRARAIFAVMDDLPRTDNGKVSRAKVRDFFREQQKVAQA